MYRKQVVDYLVYFTVRCLICFAQAIRIETGHELARWVAWLLGDVLRIRADVVDENLRHAFADLSPEQRKRLARQMWEHLLLLVLEIAHVPRKVHETNWRSYVRHRDSVPLVRYLLSDRPVIIVTAHFGNFEVGGYALGVLGFPSYTVARNLDNPYLDRFLARFRGATGQHMIPKNGGFDQIVAVLSGGGTMVFLADQYAGEKGCWVEFFGRPASAHKAIALLALEYDAPVVVCEVLRRDRPMQFELGILAVADPRSADDEVANVRAMTQWYTRHLERAIRGAPQQYWWLHRRWKDTRKGGRRKAEV